MRTLEEIRRDTARCDEEIMRQLLQRMAYIQEIIAVKKAEGIPILQPEREAQRAAQLDAMIGNSEYREELLGVFDSVVAASKRTQARALFSGNIYLVGFMGVGKSTVSRHLKDMLAMREVETDAMVEQDEGMRISDIFAVHGEAYFRNCESNALLRLRGTQQLIVSCGGGIVMRPENVTEMRRSGHVVLLTASPETVLARVKNSNTRPILQGNKNVAFIRDLMQQRDGAYRSAAEITVSTDGRSANDICEELIGKLIRLGAQQEAAL